MKDRVQEQEFGSSGVKAEYVLQGSRWHLKHLTYRWIQYFSLDVYCDISQ